MSFVKCPCTCHEVATDVKYCTKDCCFTHRGKVRHHFKFWGDDPYLICECGEIRDALTEKVITHGNGKMHLEVRQ